MSQIKIIQVKSLNLVNLQQELMPKKSARKASSSNKDGFSILKADNWYFDKLRIIQSYIKAYHKRFDLRNKTKMLVYIGSGPGVVQLDEELEVPGTPLEILGMSTSFQRYIYCEKNPEYAKALKVRVGRDYPKKHSIIIEGYER